MKEKKTKNRQYIFQLTSNFNLLQLVVLSFMKHMEDCRYQI